MCIRDRYCIDPYSIDAKGDIDFDEDFFITKDKGTKTDVYKRQILCRLPLICLAGPETRLR